MPVQMAAVMAAMLKAWERTAPSAENQRGHAEDRVGTGVEAVTAQHSMRGMYCSVRVIRNSGNATLNNALTENSGRVNTGVANSSVSP